MQMRFLSDISSLNVRSQEKRTKMRDTRLFVSICCRPHPYPYPYPLIRNSGLRNRIWRPGWLQFGIWRKKDFGSCFNFQSENLPRKSTLARPPSVGCSSFTPQQITPAITTAKLLRELRLVALVPSRSIIYILLSAQCRSYGVHGMEIL